MDRVAVRADKDFPPEDTRDNMDVDTAPGEGTEKEKAIRETSKGERRGRRQRKRGILKEESARGRETGERRAWGGGDLDMVASEVAGSCFGMKSIRRLHSGTPTDNQQLLEWCCGCDNGINTELTRNPPQPVCKNSHI